MCMFVLGEYCFQYYACFSPQKEPGQVKCEECGSGTGCSYSLSYVWHTVQEPDGSRSHENSSPVRC